MTPEMTEPDTISQLSLNTKISITLLICGKFVGIMGAVLGFTPYRTLAGFLVFLYGVFIFLTVALCLWDLQKNKKEEIKKSSLIDQMLIDGSLKQKLRDAGYQLVESK